jgi:hypothetical protein
MLVLVSEEHLTQLLSFRTEPVGQLSNPAELRVSNITKTMVGDRSFLILLIVIITKRCKVSINE